MSMAAAMKSGKRARIEQEAIVKVKPILSDLPDDAIVEILTRLPVKDLLRFRCVCKSWDSMISDPQFAKLHRYKRPCLFLHDKNHFIRVDCQEELENIDDYGPIPKPPTTMYVPIPENIPVLDNSNIFPIFLGSCNGLMCLQTTHQTMILWNPSTGKFKYLPKLHVKCPNFFWFGYDKSVDDYKLVVSDYFQGYVYNANPVSSMLYVLTLKSNSWRKLINKGVNFGTRRSCKNPATGCGTLLIGTLHWLVSYTLKSDSESFIAAFDLSTEKFQTLSIPDSDHHTIEYKSTIGALGGCLRLCSYFLESAYCQGFELWIMKEYGMKSSWTKMAKLSRNLHAISFDFTPLYFAKEDEIVAVMDDWIVGRAWIGRLNITNLTLSKLLVVSTGLSRPWIGHQSIVHMESLVSVAEKQR